MCMYIWNWSCCTCLESRIHYMIAPICIWNWKLNMKLLCKTWVFELLHDWLLLNCARNAQDKTVREWTLLPFLEPFSIWLASLNIVIDHFCCIILSWIWTIFVHTFSIVNMHTHTLVHAIYLCLNIHCMLPYQLTASLIHLWYASFLPGTCRMNINCFTCSWLCLLS